MNNNLNPETLDKILQVHKQSLAPFRIFDDGNVVHYYDQQKGAMFEVKKKRGDRKIETTSMQSFMESIEKLREIATSKPKTLITVGFDSVSALIDVNSEIKDVVRLTLAQTPSFATFSDLVEEGSHFSPADLHKFWIGMWGPFGEETSASIFPANKDENSTFGEIMSEVEFMLKRTKGMQRDDLGTGNISNEAVLTVKAGDHDQEIPTRWIWNGYIYEESPTKSTINWVLQAQLVGEDLAFSGIDRDLSAATKSARESIVFKLRDLLTETNFFDDVILCEGTFVEAEGTESRPNSNASERRITM